MEERKQRVKALIDHSSEFKFFVLAPGRVNIIGEHIDYCGYGVLPMAVQQNILVGVCVNQFDEFVFLNTNPEFQKYSCKISEMEIKTNKPQWYHYVMCGIKGIMEHFNLNDPVGMTLAVDGNVPCNAGLSSSSALVCASAYGTLTANGLKMEKVELANLAASCEKYIGTQGGGMDQAISFLAKQGKAKFIEFNPLRHTDVTLPDSALFVIINSCVEINKASTTNYNERVVECRISAKIIANNAGINWKDVKKLSDVQVALNASLYEMLGRVDCVLKKEAYTRSEICQILEISDDELTTFCLTPNTKEKKHFKLQPRARHVYEEAQRVIQFKDSCNSCSKSDVEFLGGLMNQSHDSLRDQYECSHPDLDELVSICRKVGALGSRLTGAGWGGCTVSLVKKSDVDAFIENVKETYFFSNKARSSRAKTAIFVSDSASGAEILSS